MDFLCSKKDPVIHITFFFKYLLSHYLSKNLRKIGDFNLGQFFVMVWKAHHGPVVLKGREDAMVAKQYSIYFKCFFIKG